MTMGELGGEVSLIADELSRAVELTLNPTAAHEARSQAYNACESFKENSPWCAQAGLLLARGNQYSAVVKHFGLQLMEHTVKYRWTQITQAEKIFIKENSMELLYMGGWEIGHLNDALARVIVEMIKREWPQQWPTLLAELSDACARGHAHTQIVLHIFLRLVEDVATLQTLEQHQRRKDIYQALTSNMTEIFAFFMRLIELHVQEFREKTAANDYAAAASNGRVVQVVLLTLTGFVEWVSTNHIVMNNGRLLQILCILLEDGVFQLPAAECLLQIVNRKGCSKERRPLLILLNKEAISCVHRAALASMAALDEQHYLFLKKLSQVVVGLTQLVTSLWTAVVSRGNTELTWLPVLVGSVVSLCAHASLCVTQAGHCAWLALLKQPALARSPPVREALPRYLQHAAQKLLKVTYPSSQVIADDAATYASIDFDSEQEYNSFFNKCRTDILDGFRHCMIADPLVTWSYVEQWTHTALDKVDTCPPDVDTQHPLHVEWEALSQVLEVVLSRLLQAEPRPAVSAGLQLLQRCVAATPPAPLLLSLLLSFISALFVFLSCAYSQLAGPGVGSVGAELLPRVLDKVFAALSYERAAPAAVSGPAAGQSGAGPASARTQHERAIRTVRRHAASLLVKLASKYPLLLLPVFGRIHEQCRAALARPGVSAVESTSVQEALLLISNHFCCFQRQSTLAEQVVGECSARWTGLTAHMHSAAALARLVGLDVPPPARDAPPDADPTSEARRALLHALALLLAVVRRTTIPTDPDKAMRGGFSAGVSPAGHPIWRHPCAPHVLPLLPAALQLARALHELHAPAARALRHAEHARALQPSPAERHNLLPNSVLAPQAPPDRMQNFLYTLHENVCQLVGAAASNIGREVYQLPSLAQFMLGSLLHGLEHLPDHWLRPVLRVALKPLLHHCPPAHHADVALPLLDHLLPFMLTHLTTRWEYIASLYESGQLEEENGAAESQEVLDDILVRHLTREHLDLIKVCLVDGGLGVTETTCPDMDDDSSTAAVPQRTPDLCSELGLLILQQDRCGWALRETCVRALCWGDSGASLRAVPLVQLCAGEGGYTGPALHAALLALRLHGQHDANQAALLALALQLYEQARPRCPQLAALLRDIPDVDPNDVQRLDDKILAANKPAKQDKGKRDLFKKITAKLIGRSVGQMFKKEVYIMNLPSMPPPNKDKPRDPLDAPSGAGLASLFSRGDPHPATT